VSFHGCEGSYYDILLWQRIIWYMFTDVSVEHFLHIQGSLKMEAVCSHSEDHNMLLAYFPIVSIVARQRLGEHVPAAANTPDNRIVGRVVYYAVHVVSNERR
jgi:hypothetical protein